MDALPSLHSPATKVDEKALMCLLMELGHLSGKKQHHDDRGLVVLDRTSSSNNIARERNTDCGRRKIYDRKRLPLPRPNRVVSTTKRAHHLRKGINLLNSLQKDKFNNSIKHQFDGTLSSSIPAPHPVLNSSLGELEEILSLTNLIEGPPNDHTNFDVLVGTAAGDKNSGQNLNGLASIFAAARDVEDPLPTVTACNRIQGVPAQPEQSPRKKTRTKHKKPKPFDPTMTLSYYDTGKLFKWTPVLDLEIEYFRNKMARRIQTLYRQYHAKRLTCARWGEEVPSIVVSLYYLSRNRAPGLLALLRAYKPTAVEMALVTSLNHAKKIARIFNGYAARCDVFSKLLHQARRDQQLITKIQSLWRGCLGREEAVKRRVTKSVLRIQRVGRSLQPRRVLQNKHIYYQSVGPSWAPLSTMIRSCEEPCLRLLCLLPACSKSVRIIQRLGVGYSCRYLMSIQRYQKKALLIQSAWRGKRQQNDAKCLTLCGDMSFAGPSLSILMSFHTSRVPGLQLTAQVMTVFSHSFSLLHRVSRGYMSRMLVGSLQRRPGDGLFLLSTASEKNTKPRIELEEEPPSTSTPLQDALQKQKLLRKVPSIPMGGLQALVVSYADDDPSEVLLKQLSVKCIQRVCRAGVVRKCQHRDLVARPTAALVISLAFKSFVARQKTSAMQLSLAEKKRQEEEVADAHQSNIAATLVQCQFRNHLSRLFYSEKVRKYETHKRRQNEQAAIEELFFIESNDRDEIANTHSKERIIMLKGEVQTKTQIAATCTIQTCWRRYATQRAFKNEMIIRRNQLLSKIKLESLQHLSVVRIQSFVRGFLARKDLNCRSTLCNLQLLGSAGSPSVLLLASVPTRTAMSSLKLCSIVCSADRLRLCDALLADCARLKVQRIQSARTIQSSWRGFVSKSNLRNKQSAHKNNKQTENDQSIKQEEELAKVVITKVIAAHIQRVTLFNYRCGYLPPSYKQSDCQRQSRAATIISTNWKMYSAKSSYRVVTASLMTIQRVGRALALRACLVNRTKQSLLTVQRVARAGISRWSLSSGKSHRWKAVIKIQAIWKGALTRMKESSSLDEQISELLTRSQQMAPKTIDSETSDLLQSDLTAQHKLILDEEARCWSDLKLDFHSRRPVLVKYDSTENVFCKAAIKIQAIFRGVKVRQQEVRSLDRSINELLTAYSSR